MLQEFIRQHGKSAQGLPVSQMRAIFTTCQFHSHVVQMLVKSCGNPCRCLSQHDFDGNSALSIAARNGDHVVVDQLLKAGHPCSTSVSQKQKTALHWAAYMGHSKVVSILLHHCALPPDVHNLSAEAEAARFGFDQIAANIQKVSGKPQEASLRFGGAGETMVIRSAAVNGGWAQGRVLNDDLDTKRCDLERVHISEMTPASFSVRMRQQLPYVIVGAVPPEHAVWKAWTAQNFKNHPIMKSKVNVGRIPYSLQFGLYEREMTLEKYVALGINGKKGPDPPVYVFKDLLHDLLGDENDSNATTPRLGADGLHWPDWIQNMTQRSYQFYIGPPGSGAPVHFHQDAINFLVYGRKRWFLFHPSDTAYSRKHPLQWFRAKDGLAKQKHEGRIYECVQQQGEAIVVPSDWGHGVLNIDTSIGAAFELEREDPSRTEGKPGLWSRRGLNNFVAHSSNAG